MEHNVSFEDVVAALEESLRKHRNRAFPFVTVSYAQSLDGCISSSHDERLSLSGREASQLTHRLRVSHNAILIGIGTVQADDPLLTVRYVQGTNPQPVVFDSRLRFPLDARLITENPLLPWIFTTQDSDPQRKKILEDAGARVVTVQPDENGRVDAVPALAMLGQYGITSVMVEGGAGIITTFLSRRLLNKLIITVTPLIIGGLHAEGDLAGTAASAMVDFHNVTCSHLGEDLIITADSSQEE